MKQRAAVAIIAGVVALALLLLYLMSGGDGEEVATASSVVDEAVDIPADPTDVIAVALYFPDANGLLSAEEHQIPLWLDPVTGSRRLVGALLAGPQDPALNSPLPEQVSLGQVYLSPGSVVYVDLVSTTLGSPPASGSQMEMMTVYSLVNTLMLGIPEIEAVVLLWNGRQLTSFGGHIDTSQPLVANRDLLRTRR